MKFRRETYMHGPSPKKNKPNRTGAWTADDDDIHPWIQANFDGEKRVTSITTQGRPDASEWVTSYQVAYRDASGTWQSVKHTNNRRISFRANTDRNTRVTNSMPDGVVATKVRLWPVSWNRRVSMRFLVQGCDFVAK